MADYTEDFAKATMRGRWRPSRTEKEDAPVFLATAVGYAANLAALLLLAGRFVDGGTFDGASAWRFIALSCIAAVIIGALILRGRECRRSGCSG